MVFSYLFIFHHVERYYFWEILCDFMRFRGALNPRRHASQSFCFKTRRLVTLFVQRVMDYSPCDKHQRHWRCAAAAHRPYVSSTISRSSRVLWCSSGYLCNVGIRMHSRCASAAHRPYVIWPLSLSCGSAFRSFPDRRRFISDVLFGLFVICVKRVHIVVMAVFFSDYVPNIFKEQTTHIQMVFLPNFRQPKTCVLWAWTPSRSPNCKKIAKI